MSEQRLGPRVPQEPQAQTPGLGIGQLAQQSPVDIQPIRDEADLQQRTSAFEEFFRNPQTQAMLIQMGGRLLQPMAPGQTFAGQVGQALTEGAAAGGRVAKAQVAQGNVEADRALAERGVTTQEERTQIQAGRATEQARSNRAREGLEGERVAIARDTAASTLAFNKARLALLERGADLDERKFAAEETKVATAKEDAIQKLLIESQLARSEQNRKIMSGSLDAAVKAFELSDLEPEAKAKAINAMAKSIFETQKATLGGGDPRQGARFATLVAKFRASGSMEQMIPDVLRQSIQNPTGRAALVAAFGEEAVSRKEKALGLLSGLGPRPELAPETPATTTPTPDVSDTSRLTPTGARLAEAARRGQESLGPLARQRQEREAREELTEAGSAKTRRIEQLQRLISNPSTPERTKQIAQTKLNALLQETEGSQ